MYVRMYVVEPADRSDYNGSNCSNDQTTVENVDSFHS